nr:immunoglobulin light chain junction region [Macaca mulatta]MPN68009.1 immunoglobulin light chain junction region [Macaca mulatta]
CAAWDSSLSTLF